MEELLTAKQMAKKLAMPISTLYSLVEHDEIPYYRIEGRIKFSPSKVEEWLETVCGRGPSDDSSSLLKSVRTNRSQGIVSIVPDKNAPTPTANFSKEVR